ncbi:MAG: AAA family ATPase [Candidatus Limnocylindria bacterium]
MPSNAILICARSPELRSELESALAAAGYATASVSTPADAVAAMRGRPADLIVAEGLAASGAISSLRTAGSAGITPILVVAPAHDIEARIAFLEAGADDVIVGGFAPNELEGRVTALLIRSGKVRPEASHAGTSEIVAFFSPKGGVGTTTLAVNTAVLLAGGGAPPPAQNGGNVVAIPASRILLIDLDLQFGQVATHLNLTPRYDVAGLASDEQALADPELARSYLTMHSSGLAVLAAPTRPEADFRVTLEGIQRMIEIMRPSFDHIIVDLGSRLEPRTLWLLEQADSHLFVLFPEIAALRAMSLLMTFLAETTPLQARSHIVINHVFPKELLKTRDVENLLRTKPAAEVPYTEVEMIRSVNEGVPLVIGRPASPAATALRRVAQTVIGIEQQAPNTRKPQRRGIFKRR